MMKRASSTRHSSSIDLRLWPGVVIVLAQTFGVFGTKIVAPASMLQFFGMMSGPILTLVLLLVWWLLLSRAPKPLRILGAFLPFVAFGVAMILTHPSAVMAMMVFGLTIFSLAFVAVAAWTRHAPDRVRRRALALTTIAAAAIWPFLRTEGVDGDMGTEYAWRFSATAEERFLASDANIGSAIGDLEARVGAPEAVDAVWPGFRGPNRDGALPGLRIATNWDAAPPKEIWRRKVGPGWSSVTIVDDTLYTQEQRGDDEVVTAYRASTGEPLWVHGDTARFWEALAGAGPRATPTYHRGRLYTVGATGIVNALDARTGAVIWQRDLSADTGAPVPDWGFSASPWIVDSGIVDSGIVDAGIVDSGIVDAGVTDVRVVIHAGGPDGKGVVAYDAATGEPAWFAAAGALSYSSIHEATLDGVRQLVIATGDGIRGLAPGDGAELWRHAWPMPGGARIVQPAFVGDTGVLIGTGFGFGVRRIEVRQADDGWTVEERWTSTGLKPYYNDFVVHEGHAYGFDGRILAALDLETGDRAWKGGRYGNGQALLLPDQDLLVVLSDRGEVALVAAEPTGFEEIARLRVLDGKTWNHPVIAHDTLFVRNGEEMAALALIRDRVARR